MLGRRRLLLTFRALRSANYRRYFVGQGISLIGTWMQRLGMNWLVYRLTRNPLDLGIAEFASQFTAFLLMPFAGALLDRWNLRRALFIIQTIALVHAVLLAALVIGEAITFPILLVLCVIGGAINAFDMPGRQAFAVQLVDDKRDLSNAIALNSTIFNLARLLGPTIAGVAIKLVGEGWCFAINAASFLPICIALLRIEPNEAARRPPSRLWEGIRTGWHYTWHHHPIRTILAELGLVSLVGMPFVVLLPVFAEQVYGGGADTYGFLMGASGVGALAGALFMASRRQLAGFERQAVLAFAGFGLGFCALAATPWLSLALGLMTVTGCCMVIGWSSSNTMLQAMVDDDKRARVMSLYMMSFMGTAPIGSLIAGGVARHLGAPTTLAAAGGLCLLGTAALTPAMLRVGAALPTRPHRHAGSTAAHDPAGTGREGPAPGPADH